MIATTKKTQPQRSQWLKPEDLARLSSLELRARGVVEGFLQGLHRSPFIGYSVEFSSHRRYGPGDDLRHVNWKVFARQRKLYVKEFDAETNLNLYLFVDVSRSMQCKVDGAMTKHEYAATLAAAMALIAMKQRDAVALGIDGRRGHQLSRSVSQAGPLGRMRTNALAGARKADNGTRQVTGTSRRTGPAPWDRRHLQRLAGR